MKLNSVCWSVPGTKRCVHQHGMTAVVSDTDCVYLYEGEKGEKTRVLAFNPRTNHAVSIDENSGERQWSVDEIERCESRWWPERVKLQNAKKFYLSGLQLLAASRYATPGREEERIREWLQRVWERPPVETERLEKGNCLVAAMWRHYDPHPGKIDTWVCRMLGGFMRRNENVFTFQARKDPDLEYGIRVEQKNPRKWDFNLCELPSSHEYLIAGSDRVAEITREEAGWLRQFLPPIPARQFLHIHNMALERAEALKRERKRKIQQSVVSSYRNTQLVGKVAI